MAKRTIKDPAGSSRISIDEATAAARVVYRDGTTGRFVIVEQGSPLKSHKNPKTRSGLVRSYRKKR